MSEPEASHVLALKLVALLAVHRVPSDVALSFADVFDEGARTSVPAYRDGWLFAARLFREAASGLADLPLPQATEIAVPIAALRAVSLLLLLYDAPEATRASELLHAMAREAAR